MPKKNSSPPTAQNARLVAAPSAAIVTPRLTPIGQTVGFGISTVPPGGAPSCSGFAEVPCVMPRSSCLLPANQIDQRKHHHPDAVNKVPIPRDDFDADR